MDEWINNLHADFQQRNQGNSMGETGLFNKWHWKNLNTCKNKS